MIVTKKHRIRNYTDPALLDDIRNNIHKYNNKIFELLNHKWLREIINFLEYDEVFKEHGVGDMDTLKLLKEEQKSDM